MQEKKLEECEAQAFTVTQWKKSGQFRNMSLRLNGVKCQYS